MGKSDTLGKGIISLLNKVIDKLIKIKICHLLWMSVLASEIFTAVIVSIMSIAFYGRVTNDYLITGSVTALLVSFVVVFVLLSILKQMRRTEAEHNRLLNILEASLNEIYTFDPDTLRLSYVNAGAVRNLGYSMDELKMMTPLDLKPEFDEVSFRNLIAPLINHEKEKLIFQTVHRRADGSLYPVEVHLQLIGYDGEKVFLAIILDITERKEAEEFMRGILESVGEGFLVIDPAYRIILANKSYCERTKTSLNAIKGRCCYEISHRIDKPCFEAGEICAPRHTFETGEACTALHTHYDRDGNPIYVETRSFPMNDAHGNVIAVIEIVDDITEKKRLEDQLRQSQKMEAVGKLAGGIAHDFNNILTAIIGYGSLLQADIGEDSHLISRLEHILTSAGKAANLTRQLLAFSRKQIMSPKPVNLNDIIRDMEKLLTRLVSEDIEIKIKIGRAHV